MNSMSKTWKRICSKMSKNHFVWKVAFYVRKLMLIQKLLIIFFRVFIFYQQKYLKIWKSLSNFMPNKWSRLTNSYKYLDSRSNFLSTFQKKFPFCIVNILNGIKPTKYFNEEILNTSEHDEKSKEKVKWNPTQKVWRSQGHAKKSIEIPNPGN